MKQSSRKASLISALCWHTFDMQFERIAKLVQQPLQALLSKSRWSVG
jgi:hypothetical protein